MKKKLSVVLALVLILSFVAPVMAYEEPSVWAKIVDALLVRPACVVGSVAATAFFIATLPVTFPIGVSEQLSYAIVEAPWRFTAGRYPGEYDHYYDEGPITTVHPYP
jgi:hypothetical protein